MNSSTIGHRIGTFRVMNVHGAGSVRANILADDCFRKTGSCAGEDCIAEVEYKVLIEECLNY